MPSCAATRAPVLALLLCLPAATGFASPSHLPAVMGSLRASSRGAVHALAMQQEPRPAGAAPDRRSVLAGLILTAIFPGAAWAFPNRIGELSPNLKGVPYGSFTPVPNGVGTGGEPLAGCTAAPNCFSSGADKGDKDHYLPAWSYSKDSDAAWAEIQEAVKAYKPGQSGVDGGGWQIAKETPGYLYVQYESEKIGYLDDLEFVHDKAGKKVLLRSSSRAGYLDFAVNAKRLNFYSKVLGDNGGWDAPPITAARYPNYFGMNGGA